MYVIVYRRKKCKKVPDILKKSQKIFGFSELQENRADAPGECVGDQ